MKQSKIQAVKYGREFPRTKQVQYDVSNSVMAVTDGDFKKACEKAGITPTARQASKFRRGFGLAFQSRNKEAA